MTADERYEAELSETVGRQDNLRSEILSSIGRLARKIVTDWPWQWQWKGQQPDEAAVARVSSSRWYGTALPDSDLDIPTIISPHLSDGSSGEHPAAASNAVTMFLEASLRELEHSWEG